MAQALASGALVLTATRRLARWLRRQYDETQRQAGHAAWESPRIAAFADWLREAWDDAQEHSGSAPGLLLSDAQAEALWEQILLTDPGAERVLHPRTAAALAQDAWRLSHEWRLPSYNGSGESPDVAAWLRWREDFQRRCKKEGWIDAAQLSEHIADAVRGSGVDLPPVVMLAGFEDFTPAYQSVVDTLRARGCTIEAWTPPQVGQAAVVRPCADEEAEAEAVARWARHWLEQAPVASIGVVVPNLAERRGAIERHLRAALHPGEDATRDPGRASFNISQ
ncbi:MAG TPA: hypothetical protein VF678_15570, partial [bacterium]